MESHDVWQSLLPSATALAGIVLGSSLTKARQRRQDQIERRRAAGIALGILLATRRHLLTLFALDELEVQVCRAAGTVRTVPTAWSLPRDFDEQAERFAAAFDLLEGFDPVRVHKMRGVLANVVELVEGRNDEVRISDDPVKSIDHLRFLNVKHAVPELDEYVITLARLHSLPTMWRVRRLLPEYDEVAKPFRAALPAIIKTMESADSSESRAETLERLLLSWQGRLPRSANPEIS